MPQFDLYNVDFYSYPIPGKIQGQAGRGFEQPWCSWRFPCSLQGCWTRWPWKVSVEGSVWRLCLWIGLLFSITSSWEAAVAAGALAATAARVLRWQWLGMVLRTSKEELPWKPRSGSQGWELCCGCVRAQGSAQTAEHMLLGVSPGARLFQEDLQPQQWSQASIGGHPHDSNVLELLISARLLMSLLQARKNPLASGAKHFFHFWNQHNFLTNTASSILKAWADKE